MKQSDFQPCHICGKPLTQCGAVDFHEITVERHVLNLPALRRQAGLTMMMGNTAIAAAMGPDEDMALPVPETRQRLLICGTCAIEPDHRLVNLLFPEG